MIWTEGYPFQGCSPLIDIKAATIALLSSKAADGRLAWLDWPGLGALGRRSRARICAPDRFTIGLCPKRASICQRAAKARQKIAPIVISVRFQS